MMKEGFCRLDLVCLQTIAVVAFLYILAIAILFVFVDSQCDLIDRCFCDDVRNS